MTKQGLACIKLTDDKRIQIIMQSNFKNGSCLKYFFPDSYPFRCINLVVTGL